MTKQDLIENLGTVAKSGTTQFVEALTGAEGDMSLIGQFGVGFYSVYLVADKVQVTSKHNDDEQHIWESTADATFSVAADPRGDTLGRGTEIKLFLKEDASEFLEQSKLEDLVKRYSEFITFPIYLHKSKTETVEVPIDDDDEGEEEEEEEEPKTKTETKTVWFWQHINDQPAIWTRDKSEISDEDYEQFFLSLSNKKGSTIDDDKPLSWIHFRAEGEIEFKSILYVPKSAPHDQYDNYYGKASGMRLYVRKVLITDEFEDLVPRYLNFLRGVVDSDDLPLNVSRETLQQHKVLKVMGKKLVRKALEMLRKMAQTSKTGDKLISLEDYVENMKDWQKDIYYISGSSLDEVQKSAFLEKCKAKDVEVLFLTDPIDEYAVQNLTEFDGKKLQSVTKEGLAFGDEDADLVSKREKIYQENFKPVTEGLKDVFGDAVEKVTISQRIESSPSVMVTSKYGYSANMERIMKAQAFADNKQAQFMVSKKTMEINPRHPIVIELNKLAKEDAKSEKVADLGWLLYDTASSVSGFQLDDPAAFAKRMYRLMQSGLNLESLQLADEVEVPKEEEKADEGEEEEGDDEEGEETDSEEGEAAEDNKKEEL